MRTKSIIVPGMSQKELVPYFTRQQRYEAFQALRNHVFRCLACKPHTQCAEFQRLYHIMVDSQLEATMRATADHSAMLAEQGEFTNERLDALFGPNDE